MRILFIAFIFVSCGLNTAYGQINWQASNDGVNWASACDFTNNDLSSAKVPGAKCGETCIITNGCTHFTWTDFEGGTCWMKKNFASKTNAYFTNNYNMVCGIVPDKGTNNIGTGTGKTIIFYFNMVLKY